MSAAKPAAAYIGNRALTIASVPPIIGPIIVPNALGTGCCIGDIGEIGGCSRLDARCYEAKEQAADQQHDE